MSRIYIIAGPPGIGKSTTGDQYIDPELDILNEDEMRFKYKAKGYADYNEYSIHRVRDTIRQKLIRNEDFALELNLGYPHQYEYSRSIKRFNSENTLSVILFFTDSQQLCKDRAELRFKNGRHLVKPETIEQMYSNTLPLLKSNFDLIDHLVLVDTNPANEFNLVAMYNKEQKTFVVYDHSPAWFYADLYPYLQQQSGLTNFDHSNLRSFDQNDSDSSIDLPNGYTR